MSDCATRCNENRCEPQAKKCCACGSDCGGDPVACASAIWTGSFFQAMKEVQVEILKPKIQKALGSKMDKASDAVLESMFAMWQSMLAKNSAQQGLRERLAGLYKEGK